MKKNAIFERCLANVSSEVRMEVHLNMDIANKIADILKAKNMTQRDLAALLDKRESEISRWLSGSHGFTTKSIAKISSALGENIIETTKGKEIRYVTFSFPVYVSNTDAESADFYGKKAATQYAQLS